MWSSVKPVVHTAIASSILGAAIYLGVDVAGEYSTYVILRNQAAKLAGDNERLKKQIGYPFSLGPWYNARIGFSQGRNIAQCSFQLEGQHQITDLTVRGVRQTGIANTLAYNVAGPGEWNLIECTAMFPSGGGLVQPQSLMPGADKPAPLSSAAATATTTPSKSKASASSPGRPSATDGTVGSAVTKAPEKGAPVAAGGPEHTTQGSRRPEPKVMLETGDNTWLWWNRKR